MTVPTPCPRPTSRPSIGFRHVFEWMPGVAYVEAVGTSGMTTYVSPRIEDLTGHHPERFTSSRTSGTRSSIPRTCPGCGAPTTGRTCRSSPTCEEYRMCTADGGVVWVRDRRSRPRLARHARALDRPRRRHHRTEAVRVGAAIGGREVPVARRADPRGRLHRGNRRVRRQSDHHQPEVRGSSATRPRSDRRGRRCGASCSTPRPRPRARGRAGPRTTGPSARTIG